MVITYLEIFKEFLTKTTFKGKMIGIDCYSANNFERVLGYMYGHNDRFMHGIKLLEKYVKDRYTIHEMGSPYPFFSLYFYIKKSCIVLCSDIYDRKWEFSSSMSFKQINLCTVEELPVVDIAICSEVLEHLPCNLFKVRDKVLKSCKYALFSFPMGDVGLNIKLNNEVKGDDVYNNVFEHLREFHGRVDEFLEGCTILERIQTATNEYALIELVVVKGMIKDEE